MVIEDQQRFCARWLEQRGIYDHPTLQQLMEMAEAWAAYRLRLRSCGAVASDDAPREDATASTSRAPDLTARGDEGSGPRPQTRGR